MPIVLKLSKQDWLAQSTSRKEEGLVTWRQTVAFPEIFRFVKNMYSVKYQLNYIAIGNHKDGVCLELHGHVWPQKSIIFVMFQVLYNTESAELQER